MKNLEQIFCLIKFGSSEYNEKLLKEGELYFNTPIKYNELSGSENETGDNNEGAEWIENTQLKKISVEHSTTGELVLTPIPNSLSKIIQYNYYYLSYSLFVISSRLFENTDKYQIDKKMLDMKNANSALMIKEPYKFINCIISEIKKLGLQYEAGIVEYKKLNCEGRIEIRPFDKKIEHQHQVEFRIVIENKDNLPKKIYIGSIEDYCIISSSKSMVETIWEAKRKVK